MLYSTDFEQRINERAWFDVGDGFEYKLKAFSNDSSRDRFKIKPHNLKDKIVYNIYHICPLRRRRASTLVLPLVTTYEEAVDYVESQYKTKITTDYYY